MSAPIAPDLGWLRGLSDAFLPDVCDVLRYTETSGPDGVNQSWSTIASGVPCRVSPVRRTGQESAPGGQLLALSDWTVWLPALTDVTVKDRVTALGMTFEVQRVDARSYEVIRAVRCALVT